MSDTLATALVLAQQEMPAVDKTGSSNFGKHATLDHIIANTPGVRKNLVRRKDLWAYLEEHYDRKEVAA